MWRKWIIAFRVLLSDFFVLHIGYWLLILIKFEWVSYSSMVRPPTFVTLVFSAFAVYVAFPYGTKSRNRMCKWGMAISLFAFLVGSAMDFVSRVRLAKTIEKESVLRFEDSAGRLSADQKDNLVKMLQVEPIKINWMYSAGNMFVGFSTCMCGDGDGIEDGFGELLFTSKHDDELYIRGFLSFYSTRHIVWDIDS